MVGQQIAAVAEDLPIHAAKTGALGSADIIAMVAKAVEHYTIPNLIVDPVMVSKHGDSLLTKDAVEALKRLLMPKALLITPNLEEASALSGLSVKDEASMREAARALRELGGQAVLLKGGHLSGKEAVDLLYYEGEFTRLSAPRIDTPHTHGTGCTYSAAITALLARGEPLIEAVRQAKDFVTRAIRGAPGLGHGRGPLSHWA